MSPQPKSTSSSIAKTPLVTKGARESKQEKSGMLFTFIEEDMGISSYISRDPIFDGVVGYQKSHKFLTAPMVEHMKAEIVKADNEEEYGVSEISKINHPLSEDQVVELLNMFAECMEECKGGEKIHASFTFVNVV